MMAFRSRLFGVLAGVLILGMGIVGAPVVLWSNRLTRGWMRLHNRILFAMARVLIGIRVEVRGAPPAGTVLIAAKHQSLLDVLILYNALSHPRFVMKKELMWTPVFGLYAWRNGAVPIDRSGGRGTTRALVDAFRGCEGQIVIYPQGTRVPPGETRPWKRGIAVLAGELGHAVVPVATNTGLFWPKKGPRRPGLAVVEFLEPVPAGMAANALMTTLETRIEAESARLCAEHPAQA